MSASPPLVPPDVDLRGYEFMPLYGHHLFGSDFNARVSDAGWRAALTLWWAAWNQVPAASLPADDIALTRLAALGRDVKTFRKLKPEALHGFIECDDGRLYHRALAVWALQAWERRIDHRDTAEAKNERQKRWRERCKLLGEQLRAVGITPPRGASLETLERLHAASTGDITNDVSQDANVDVSRDAVEIAKKGSEAKGSEATLKPAVVETPTIDARATVGNGQTAEPKVKTAFEDKENLKPADGQGQKWDSPKWVAATGEMLGKQRHPNESEGDYRDRIFGAIQEKIRGAKSELRKHGP